MQDLAVDAKTGAPDSYAVWLWVFMSAALVLRVAVGLIHPLMLPDSYDYLHLARCIEHGNAYRVTHMYAKRLPGYPIFLAAILAADGGHLWGITACQAVIGALSVYLVWCMALRISRGTAIIAAAWVALDPLLIGFSASYLSETLFIFIFLLSLLTFMRMCSGIKAWRSCIEFALLFVMSIYVRAEIALCLFPLLALYLWKGKAATWGRKLVHGVVILAIVLLGMMPWWIRNWDMFHSNFFRFSTLEGISLYESVYAGATGGPRQSDIALPPAMKHLNESQRDNRWTQMAFGCIAHHPLRIARLAVIKIGRTWSPWLHADGFRNWWLNLVLTIWYVAQYLFAIRGLIWLCREKSHGILLGIILIPILYLTAMHAIFLGSVRYRVPLIPLIGILAAVGVCRAWTAWSFKMPPLSRPRA